MGNAGSAHNLQNDCIEGELNLCYTQQYLRRSTGEAKNKNQAVLGGWSSGRNVADCKVLPKPTENLKLRATTNGAILQAGGTISFRAKEQAERKNESTTFQPMRRCHTLILDGQNEAMSKRNSAPPLTEFRRSQTLLFVGYNKRKPPENISKNFDYTPQAAAQNTSSSSTLKVNKYNKKRKAPPAPVKNLPKEDATSPAQNQLLTDVRNPTAAKSRIYTTNNSKSQMLPKQRESLRSSARQVQPTTSSSYASKLPYRREKTIDAKLLSKTKPNDGRDESVAAPTARELRSAPHSPDLEFDLSRNAHKGNGKQKPARQQGVAANLDVANFSKSYHSETDYLRNRSKKEADKFGLSQITQIPNFTESSNDTNDKKSKHPQSRIPQLKRTFYFGMDSVSKSANISATLPTPKAPNKMSENVLEDTDNNSLVLTHKIDAEEEILDNGILVHVRPTLPRRQLETPSFSPSAAWRKLLEDQQCLQLERSKPKQNCPDQRILETPICLKSCAKENHAGSKANWTPQQDLDDDDDEEAKEVKKVDNFSTPLHIFSLSLPRDVHLQCQNKSAQKSTEPENSWKSANCWLVPGFNSLQKFKTQVGKPTDFQSSSKCTCVSNAASALPIDSRGYHQPYCELNKTASKPTTSYQNNNWLLHKSKTKDLPAIDTTKIIGDSGLKSTTNSLSFINFQPKSLTNIYSGKHIVYLPGQDALHTSIKESYKNAKQNKTLKANHKRQRQSQENARESLQDLTPIQTIHQSNVNATEKNTHRFSFQSTVRVLEKRRLAEKLSKDAEVQEAQRLSELEVMKRVEEDFQRKRAPEKANLRKQLRLHFKANAENSEYRSLPLNINDKFQSQHMHSNQHLSDANNNVFCRAEPDGAVSPSAELNDDLSRNRHANNKFLLSSSTKTAAAAKDLDCFAYDGEESESETQLPDLQCAALLIEPYLNSVI